MSRLLLYNGTILTQAENVAADSIAVEGRAIIAVGKRLDNDPDFKTFAKYDLKRNWIIENHGVDPDIEVEYPPEIVYKGGDPQIDRAVQELMNKITTAPRTLPQPPPVPPEKR